MKRKSKNKTNAPVKAGTSKAAAAARRAAFIEAYIQNGGNGTQAAITAGYSASRAKQTAAELVTDRDVSESIKRRRAQAIEKAQEKTELTIKEMMESLARDLRFDPAKLYNPDGSFKSIHDIDVDTRLSLRSAEIEEIKADGKIVGRTSKVKFPEKTTVREQGMKHFGMFEKDNRQRSPLEGFSNVDARALREWLRANRPPDPATGSGS